MEQLLRESIVCKCMHVTKITKIQTCNFIFLIIFKIWENQTGRIIISMELQIISWTNITLHSKITSSKSNNMTTRTTTNVSYCTTTANTLRTCLFVISLLISKTNHSNSKAHKQFLNKSSDSRSSNKLDL